MFANMNISNSSKRKIAKAKAKANRQMKHRGTGRVSSGKAFCATCRGKNLQLDKEGRCKKCIKEFDSFEQPTQSDHLQELSDIGMTGIEIADLFTNYNIRLQDLDEVEITEIGNVGWEITTNEGNFLIFIEFDDAKSYAEDRVREDLEEMPETFNDSFLHNHVFVSETDARMIAQDQAESDRERWEEDTTEELISQLKSQDIKYHNTQTENLSREYLIEEIISNESDRIEKEIIESPIAYFVTDNGYYSKEELMQQNWISLNVHDAAEEAVRSDGVAHYLARYDGEEYETNNGLYVYRTE
jgi:hypothetical protein